MWYDEYLGMPPQSMCTYTVSCTVYGVCDSVCHFYYIIVHVACALHGMLLRYVYSVAVYKLCYSIVYSE
jgi:hypothetical protein